MTNEISIKQQIKQSKSIEEVRELLKTASTYQYASNHTLHQWEKLGKIAETSAQLAETPEVAKEVVKATKKTKLSKQA